MRILIHGYDNVNLGDDLFFKILVSKYPNVDFVMLSINDYSRIINEPNLHCIKYNLFNRIGNKFSLPPYQLINNKIDAIVIIGGSIFMEVGNSGYCGTVESIKKYKRWWPEVPIHIIGSNYGPARTKKFEKTLRSIFHNVSSVCLRDSYSYGFFKDIPNVSYASDVVFQLSSISGHHNKSNTIGISLIDLEKREELKKYQHYYLSTIKDIIDEAIRKEQRISLFSFCENEGDSIVCREIKKLYENNLQANIDIIRYTGNIEQFLEAFGNVDLLYATRYHATILGLLLQIPTVPIIYSDKTLYALSDIDFKSDYIDIRKEKYVTVENDNHFVLSTKKLNEIIASSNNQFSNIDKYLSIHD